MKTLTIITAACMLSICAVGQTSDQTSQKPDSLGLPGDNLNLNAVLNAFKESSSVEDFEKQLNDPDTKLNNLDLNNDGKVDYLRVQDKGKKDYHTLVIQDMLGEKEVQDVAVINVNKKGDKVAQVQIIGDKSLYGKNYIIEPKVEDSQAQDSTVSNQQNTGSNSKAATVINNYNTTNNSYVRGGNYGYYGNPWYWPSVSFLYSPGYSYWNSPYYWGYYPVGWYGWRPMYYRSYCSLWFGNGWYGHYYRARSVYGPGYRSYHLGFRTTSVMVHRNIRNNVYSTGYANGGGVHRMSNTTVKSLNYSGGPRATYGGFNRTSTVNQPARNNQNFNRGSFSQPNRTFQENRPSPQFRSNNSFQTHSFQSHSFQGHMGGGMGGGMGHYGGGRR